MPVDPKRVKAIFLEVAELPDEAARVAYLDRACGGDAGLRARVEILLRSHDPDGSFLGTPAAVVPDPDHAGTVAFAPTPEPDHDATRTSGGTPGPDPDDEALGFLTPSTRPDSLGRIGHYEVLQVLGRGGFGIVFRTFDDVLLRVVAVKVLAPQMAATSPARKRFLREARSSAAVRHENVVQVYEVGETPLPYIAMEFIPGETLQQRLDRIGPIDVADVVRIGRQIAEGLAAAHATDLIHRDIKPGNILLEGGQQKVKLTDFGLARAADDASISQSGIIAGTPMYMAPEQAKGETLDQRADLFSLGSVLYQMAAGRAPFRANNTVAVLKRVAEDTPRPIREIIPETPQWLCDIIARLHAKNPDDRYQSAREVADVLADCEAQLKAKQEVKNVLPAAVKPTRWKWSAAAVAGFFLLACAVVGYLFGKDIALLLNPAPPPANPLGPVVDPPPSIQPGPKIIPVEKVAKPEPPPTYTNSLGMEFVIVSKGKSWLGGGKDKPGYREVEIPADFYLGKYEVTQEEWQKVMGENPSWFSRTGAGKEAVKDIPDADLKRFPVESVSWDDCQRFINKLNQTGGETGWVYRLPTATEWEYACRGGPSDRAGGAFEFYLATPTNVLNPEQANFNSGLGRTCRVGSYGPNVLGLHDMHGNIAEWCDGRQGPIRLIRGGCWHDEAGKCGLSFLAEMRSAGSNVSVGLRLARVPSGAPSPTAKTPPADPDRRAAEYVFSAGGAVKVNGQDQAIKAAADLPREPFRLTVVDLSHNTQVTDEGLTVFKDCANVSILYLYFARPVTDAGLAHFAGCKNLTQLHLQSTSVTDAGLARFKGSTAITDLYLSGSGVTDEGIANFKDCKGLTHLGLHGTRVTAARLNDFQDCKRLRWLNLGDTATDDEGVALFKGCKNLGGINLNHTRVTDAGLADLAGLDQLTELRLTNTQVTAKGVEGLAKALPKCKIEWDGGVIEPK